MTQPTIATRPHIGRPPVWAKNGMVACAQPLAAVVGVDVLKRGGTAVDAAIATNACLGLMEPTANGIGGDLFAIVWDPVELRLAGLNASGRAPAAHTIEKLTPFATPDGTISLDGPHSWSVPGCVDGWSELHGRYGRLPFADLLEPAAAYAEEGFPVSPRIARLWEQSPVRRGIRPGFAEVYMPGGRTPGEGELFRNPALARTLRLIGREGRDAYYRGPVAAAVTKFSAEVGGCFAREDFAGHHSTWDAPIATDYRGWTIWELPPNSQGLAALQLLNILEGFDVRAMGREPADFWHLCVEAKKLAFADRAKYYADPAFSKVPSEELLSKQYARQRALEIRMDAAALSDRAGDPVALSRHETTYLCAADRDGMMVSLIQSNYTGFGSGYAVPEVGFGLQNRGALFSLDPGHANALEPGKRPFQTIIPAFVTKDGAPLMAFGLMGGDMQPQGHAQVIMNLVDFDMNLQEAGDAIRFHHGGSSGPTGTVMTDGGVLHIEDGLPEPTLQDLVSRGHRFERYPMAGYGGYQAIRRDPETGIYAGATEVRKDGCALGY